MVIDRITRLRLVKAFNEPIVNTALKNGVKLLKEKVHFPDAKVRVISGQTSIASRKTFSTPFL